MYFKVLFATVILCLLENPVTYSLPAKPEWPRKCNGKSYCPFKPRDYPQKMVDEVLKDVFLNLEQFNGITNRSGEEKDVGDCDSHKLFQPLYLIKDIDDNVRYVMQNKNFTFLIQIEECKHPGKVTSSRFLDDGLLQQEQVYCTETRPPLALPVLSLDGLNMESVVPQDGLSVSCSAKKMRTT